MNIISALLIGAIFGLGIALSGMANPAKVLNFFDIAGTWDPSLAFVMFPAMLTAMVGYRLVLARPKPLLMPSYSLPDTTRIDASLIGGSALFGIGWGIAGFCPGGTIPALGLGHTGPFVFLFAMAGGILAARAFRNWQGGLRPAAA
jgi:uncharacterized membrane protein YedE/YeeE